MTEDCHFNIRSMNLIENIKAISSSIEEKYTVIRLFPPWNPKIIKYIIKFLDIQFQIKIRSNNADSYKIHFVKLTFGKIIIRTWVKRSFCWREFRGYHYSTMHLPDEGHSISYALIPSGGPPGALSRFFSGVEVLITLKIQI